MTVDMEIIIHLRNTMVVVSVEIRSRHLAFMDGKYEFCDLFFVLLCVHQTFFFDRIFSVLVFSLGGAEPIANPDLQTQPAMMTLKQFLATQDDSISDSDAIDKYNDYKLEFKRQQLNEFFVAHKDEEW